MGRKREQGLGKQKSMLKASFITVPGEVLQNGITVTKGAQQPLLLNSIEKEQMAE